MGGGFLALVLREVGQRMTLVDTFWACKPFTATFVVVVFVLCTCGRRACYFCSGVGERGGFQWKNA